MVSPLVSTDGHFLTFFQKSSTYDPEVLGSSLRRFLTPEALAEDPARGRADQKQLQRQSHDEVAAVRADVVGQELDREAVAMPHRKDACQRDLTDDREHLNTQDDGDRPVTRAINPEGQLFRRRA